MKAEMARIPNDDGQFDVNRASDIDSGISSSESSKVCLITLDRTRRICIHHRTMLTAHKTIPATQDGLSVYLVTRIAATRNIHVPMAAIIILCSNLNIVFSQPPSCGV